MAGLRPPPPPPLEENFDSDCMEQGETVFQTASKKKKTNSQIPAAAAVSTGAIPKRSRKQAQSEGHSDPASNRLLENNKFALLPVENGSGEPIAKKERVPPLFTPIRDLLKLQSELTQLSLEPLYKKCSKGTKIVCSNLQDYRQVSELLTAHSVPFYTHDNQTTKPLKVVLRGLPTYEASEVKSELERLGLKPEAVYPMSRRSQAINDDPYRDELFLVHFSKGTTTIGALRNIKQLFRVIIQWEHYRPQHRDVTQCTICLWFGHGTRNCKMIPQCNKCAGEHRSASCTQSDDTEPKCANCGQNHRATSRSCPKRTEFIRIRKEASTANQPGRHRKPPPAVTPAQFPPLQPRTVAPLLDPLPLPNNAHDRGLPAAMKRSVQPRLTIAATQPSQTSTPTPGMSYAGVTAGSSVGASAGTPTDDPPLSTEELVEIITAAIEIKRKYKTRSQQLAAIIALINKNG